MDSELIQETVLEDDKKTTKTTEVIRKIFDKIVESFWYRKKLLKTLTRLTIITTKETKMGGRGKVTSFLERSWRKVVWYEMKLINTSNNGLLEILLRSFWEDSKS